MGTNVKLPDEVAETVPAEGGTTSNHATEGDMVAVQVIGFELDVVTLTETEEGVG